MSNDCPKCKNYQEQIGSLLEQRNEATNGRRLAEEIAASMEFERDEEQSRARRLAEIADHFWAGRGRAMRTAWHFYEKYAQLREQIRREREQ